MSTSKTDDFRLEQSDGMLVVTFTPTGAKYIFETGNQNPTEPVKEEPSRSGTSDYAESEVRQMASKLAVMSSSAPDTHNW